MLCYDMLLIVNNFLMATRNDATATYFYIKIVIGWILPHGLNCKVNKWHGKYNHCEKCRIFANIP